MTIDAPIESVPFSGASPLCVSQRLSFGGQVMPNNGQRLFARRR
jgi:hypothetical protein